MALENLGFKLGSKMVGGIDWILFGGTEEEKKKFLTIMAIAAFFGLFIFWYFWAGAK